MGKDTSVFFYPVDSASGPAASVFTGASPGILKAVFDWIFWKNLESPDLTGVFPVCMFGEGFSLRTGQGRLTALRAIGLPGESWCWLKDWGITAALNVAVDPATGLVMPSPADETPAAKIHYSELIKLLFEK